MWGLVLRGLRAGSVGFRGLVWSGLGRCLRFVVCVLGRRSEARTFPGGIRRFRSEDLTHILDHIIESVDLSGGGCGAGCFVGISTFGVFMVMRSSVEGIVVRRVWFVGVL